MIEKIFELWCASFVIDKLYCWVHDLFFGNKCSFKLAAMESCRNLQVILAYYCKMATMSLAELGRAHVIFLSSRHALLQHMVLSMCHHGVF